MYTVYVRTNLVNGMKYVGQTKDLKRRENYWRSEKCKYANKKLSDDRFIFGLDNWSLEILAEVETREEAWELEQKFIKELDTIYPNGYNLAKGGRGSSGVEAWNKGMKGCFSEETLSKMSEKKMGKAAWNKGLKGCFSEETLAKMSEAKKKSNYCPETAFKKGNVPWNKGVKGTHFSPDTEFKGLECVQLKNGVFVKEWKTLKEAAENTPKCYSSSISKCCKGLAKKAGDFEWMYKSDYEKMLEDMASQQLS